MNDRPDLQILQQQLHEKDLLVAALTERLEQAAEQLDRLQRTGVDRPGSRRPLGGGSLPAELLDEHRTVVEDLKQAIVRWEDLQAAATLGRLEMQVGELRDLLTGCLQDEGAAAGGAMARLSAARGLREAGSTAAAKSTQGSSWWESQKAAMLGDDDAPAALSASAHSSSTAELAGDHSISEIVPEPPPPVNLDELNLDDARVAIRDRDRTILALREPLLLLQAAGRLTNGLPTMESSPAEIASRLEALEKQWALKFRQAELELSLERARLAREEAAIAMRHDEHQKQLATDARSGANDRLGVNKKGRNSPPQRSWSAWFGTGTAEPEAPAS